MIRFFFALALAAGGCGKGFAINAQAHGYVTVTSDAATGASATAAFFSDDNAADNVAVTPFGPCVFLQAQLSLGKQVAEGAGPIAITGGAKTITLMPDAGHLYLPYADGAPLWRGGETITIRAGGDAVPAFAGSAVASSSVDFTQPPLPPGGAPLAVDHKKDLAVAWSGGKSGNVRVVFDVSAASVTLACTFPSSAGSGTIPSSALAQLPTAAPCILTLGGGGLFTDYTSAGNYSVELQVLSSVTWAGAAFSPTVVNIN